ncbi:sigma factor-like helix-turn-helix DNA-binding protein [Streptomyces showdoensis]|uniref:RNA polymerase sigma factor 70 region 4 type 2 domain-containing protein n=1 Tax=Streptomyces showdoensis TaxID=68268 RepID=A0A2P2GC09_STREW|nr:sigma factor-like helix-turn-helix DNA-binding protein [Streptomyces showdoensis]KKZ68947.1 hypothetical protein VO63_36890 [Streptomyces showdoensis]
MTAPDTTPEPPASGTVERYVHPSKLTNVDLAEQQRACYELRLRHHTIREIAAITGLSVGTVHKRITDEIETTVSPYREQYRVLERERLEGISRRLLDMMSKPHYVIEKGQVLTIQGEPVEDIAVTLACTDRFLRVQERRARLEGLDAPVKVDVEAAEVQVPAEALSLIERARRQAEELRQRLEEQQPSA